MLSDSQKNAKKVSFSNLFFSRDNCSFTRQIIYQFNLTIFQEKGKLLTYDLRDSLNVYQFLRERSHPFFFLFRLFTAAEKRSLRAAKTCTKNELKLNRDNFGRKRNASQVVSFSGFWSDRYQRKSY